MNNGPLVTTGLVPTDVLAPGAGTLTASQDDREIAFEYQLPLVDADGGELTGLSKVFIGIATDDEFGNNPFVDVSSFRAVATQVQEFDVEPGGSPIFGSFPVLAFGRAHFLAAYAADDAETAPDPVE